MHHPTDRITHTTIFVTPVVEHWMEREIAQWVHPMKDRSDDPSHHERTLAPCCEYVRCPKRIHAIRFSLFFLVTPVVEHWLEREIAQWVHPMKDRSDEPSHHERTLAPCCEYIRCPKILHAIRYLLFCLKYDAIKAFVTPVVEHWLERETLLCYKHA